MENSKAIDELYIAHRLPGETLRQYHWRNKISKLAAKRGTLIHNHAPSKQRVARRQLVAEIGPRQAKKTIRLLKALRKEQLATQAAPVAGVA